MVGTDPALNKMNQATFYAYSNTKFDPGNGAPPTVYVEKHHCVCTDTTTKNMMRMVKKGSWIYMEGRIKTKENIVVKDGKKEVREKVFIIVESFVSLNEPQNKKRDVLEAKFDVDDYSSIVPESVDIKKMVE